ncbi:hypothetical protein niasHT_029334 [Heterodera trifolii]|uniref:EF-hand domain-containing protein n=1 Tax=Heterodera trifolii TaxID=157864 RepID=A0ABD2KMB3_9BILA
MLDLDYKEKSSSLKTWAGAETAAPKRYRPVGGGAVRSPQLTPPPQQALLRACEIDMPRVPPHVIFLAPHQQLIKQQTPVATAAAALFLSSQPTPRGGTAGGTTGGRHDEAPLGSINGMRNLQRRQALQPDAIDKEDLAKALADPENAFVVALQLHLKKPLSLQQLVAETYFNTEEVRAIYRVFKEASTNAIIHRDIVRAIFTQLFPRADTERFADLIFNTFDTDQSGAITFDKFLKNVSVLSRGTLEEKLLWLYRFYDPLDSGLISWHRLLYVLSVTDDLLDPRRRRGSKLRDEEREKHAQTLFKKFTGSSRQSGPIKKECFLEVCMQDATIRDSIQHLGQRF